MPLFIHLRSIDNVPESRGTSGTPFETHPTSPNDEITFGTSQRTYFSPVNEFGEPVLNDVLQKFTTNQTQDAGGVWRKGVFVAGGAYGSWDYTYNVMDQDLPVSKNLKQQELDSARLARLAQGFDHQVLSVTYTFELSKDGMTDVMVHDYDLGKNPPGGGNFTKVQDINGDLVDMNPGQFSGYHSAYAAEYQTVTETYLVASEEIQNATTPALVDAVTWNFNPV